MEPSPPQEQLAARRTNPLVRVLRWLPVGILAAALFAVGPVAIWYSFEMREKTNILTSRGETADARVINAYRAGRRGIDIHADVIFTTAEGDIRTEHLLGCDPDLLDASFVEVVYDPQDPSFLRPTDCAGSHRLAWVTLGIGIAFSAFDVAIIRSRLSKNG